MPNNSATSSVALVKLLPALLLGLALVLEVSVGHAQSGRRPPRRSDPPAGVQPPANPEPPLKTDEEPKEEKEPLIVLVVREYLQFNMPTYLANAAANGCAERLKQSRALEVRVGREMNQKEASDYAKESSEIHVVWVFLDINSLPTGNLDDLYVNYVLFEPGTGKALTRGRTYARYPGGLPRTGSRSPVILESAVREAGREAADRVTAALGLATTIDRRQRHP